MEMGTARVAGTIANAAGEQRFRHLDSSMKKQEKDGHHPLSRTLGASQGPDRRPLFSLAGAAPGSGTPRGVLTAPGGMSLGCT
jgi:hypothetical protein